MPFANSSTKCRRKTEKLLLTQQKIKEVEKGTSPSSAGGQLQAAWRQPDQWFKKQLHTTLVPLYSFSLFLEPMPPGKDQNSPGADEEELSGVTGTQPRFSRFTCFSAFGPKQLLGCRCRQFCQLASRW